MKCATHFESDPLALSSRASHPPFTGTLPPHASATHEPPAPRSSRCGVPEDGACAPGLVAGAAAAVGGEERAAGAVGDVVGAVGDAVGAAATPVTVELMGSYNQKRLSLVSQLVHLYLPAGAGVAACAGVSPGGLGGGGQGVAALGAAARLVGDADCGGGLVGGALQVEGLQAESDGWRENVLLPSGSGLPLPAEEPLRRRSSVQGVPPCCTTPLHSMPQSPAFVTAGDG